MPGLDKGELKLYLDQLIEATKSGSIGWIAVNPTTFLWDTETPRARLTIQRLEHQEVQQSPGKMPRFVQVGYYILQAFELVGPVSMPKLRISIDSSLDADLNSQLELLYDTISTAMSRQSLDFLKSVIPPKK
jgi:hypothetical protein